MSSVFKLAVFALGALTACSPAQRGAQYQMGPEAAAARARLGIDP